MDKGGKTLKDYKTLDSLIKSGVFTEKRKFCLDMKNLIEYCKQNKKYYSDLTDEEIERFKVK